jgi:hypothetical protein
VDAAAQAYAGHLNDAGQDLKQLAARATEAARRELYESGHALLENGGLNLLRRFRDAFCAAADRAVAVLSGNERDAWEGIEELSLVDAKAFERDLAIARLSAKASYACSQQLTALERRVAALLGLKRMDGEGNPFGVKRLFTAFVDAAEASWAGGQLSLTLLETLEHYTAERLPEIYREVNRYLVDNGVLPKLPIEMDEREHELDRPHRGGADAVGDVFVQLASGLTGARGAGGGWRQAGGWRGTPEAPSGGGWSGGAAAAASAPGGPAGAAGALDPTGGQMAPLVLSQLIDGLTGLQRGKDGAAAKLGIELDQLDTENPALLHSLGASPLLRWLQPHDTATIELVAMLFECIFSDAEVPEGLRTEIGKLQVPILKAALMNKAFFSDRRHPARRLLDVMAAAARGWGAREEKALLTRIRAAVANVLAGFEQDTGVFNAEADEIERILRDAEQAARGHVSELVQRLEQRDRKLVADTLVEDQIARRIDAAQPVPPAVAAFADTHWRELLGRLYVRFGDGSDAWRDALRTLEDLLWSIQPKATPEDRHRMMQMLPALLEQLPAGLGRIGRAAVWEPFLSALMSLHMAAIRPGQAAAAEDGSPKADGAPTDAQAAAPGATAAAPGAAAPAGEGENAAPLPDTEPLPWMLHSESLDALHTAAVAEPTTAEPASAPSSQPRSEPLAPAANRGRAESRDPHREAALGVELGDWLEVQQLGGVNLSLRACWMSRQSGLMLFADRRGRNARVLSTERLATALRAGSARLLSRDPLTERAVARLLVDAAPGEQTAA